MFEPRSLVRSRETTKDSFPAGGYFFPALTRAHLALCASAIRLRAAADNVLRLGAAAATVRRVTGGDCFVGVRFGNALERTALNARIARSMRLRSFSSSLTISLRFDIATGL